MTLGSRKLRGIEGTSIWSEMPGKAAGAVFPFFLVLAIVVSRTYHGAPERALSTGAEMRVC